MNETSAQPAGGKGSWWFAWILATVLIPGCSLLLLPDQNVAAVLVSLCVVVAVSLTLHIVSSFKLSSRRSSLMTVLLIFGGWVLMAASFFVGCVYVSV